MPWDIFTSSADVDDLPAASASRAAKATASCCQALSEAISRSAPTGAAARFGTFVLPSVVTRAKWRGSEVSSEAVHQGISEALRRLQEAVGAAEAADHGGLQERRAVETPATGSRLIASLLLANVPAEIVACLGCLCFEARKDAMRLFTDILKYAPLLGAEKSLVEYFTGRPMILQFLLEGCAHSSVFAHCAQMLRACTSHPQLVEALLRSGAASRLVELAGGSNFEISSEAFATLREILLAQTAVSAPILSSDFYEFFPHFNLLLGADMDYVVRRQALRLLGDVLLDRAFREVMLAYIAEDRFLQIHMNAMRESSRAIQLGSFHVFKVFVANPRKPHNVHSILYRNRHRLVKLLLVVSADCRGDAILAEDFSRVVGMLESLGAPPMKRAVL